MAKAGKDYIRLLEEFERFDVELGRVTVELYELRKRLPPSERKRVDRFMREWEEGKHTLAEAKRLLRELRSRYGDRSRGR